MGTSRQTVGNSRQINPVPNLGPGSAHRERTSAPRGLHNKSDRGLRHKQVLVISTFEKPPDPFETMAMLPAVDPFGACGGYGGIGGDPLSDLMVSERGRSVNTGGVNTRCVPCRARACFVASHGHPRTSTRCAGCMQSMGFPMLAGGTFPSLGTARTRGVDYPMVRNSAML